MVHNICYATRVMQHMLFQMFLVTLMVTKNCNDDYCQVFKLKEGKNMFMNRWLWVVVTSLLFSFASCGDSNSEDESSEGQEHEIEVDKEHDPADEHPPQPDAGSQPEFVPGTPISEEKMKKVEECVAQHCMDALTACLPDQDCNGWLECSDECGQYNMGCETFCGFYYQSEIIDNFVKCVTEAECYTLDYSYVAPCNKPTGDFFDLSGMEGKWWLSFVDPGAHVFDDGCQLFDFDEQSESFLAGTVTVPLTISDVEKIVVIEGTWVREEEGHILVEYEAFGNFVENWYILHKSENIMIARLCFMSYGDARNYGEVVLTRLPYEEIPSPERAAAEDTLITHGVQLSDLKKLKVTGCSNEWH